MVFFIPWRVVAEESGAAHFGLGGAMLLDPLGPMVRPPAAPSISILVFHRALPDLQRMKHKPDQALGHREVFLFLPSFPSDFAGPAADET
jgi:hypothetical protein